MPRVLSFEPSSIQVRPCISLRHAERRHVARSREENARRSGRIGVEAGGNAQGFDLGADRPQALGHPLGGRSIVRVAGLISPSTRAKISANRTNCREKREKRGRGGEYEVREPGNRQKNAQRPEITRAIDADGKPTEWYVRTSGRLLDRIAFEETNRVFATRSPKSLIVASKTVDGIGPEFPNRWSKLEANKPGEPNRMPGA